MFTRNGSRDDTLPERVVAFIDIGTNSVRLLLVRIDPNGAHTDLSVQKEVVRLGEGEFGEGYLMEAAMDRAAAVCAGFAEMARANSADEIIAVATSATREAENKKDFIRKLKTEAGLEVRVVSGVEEARLIYLGVASGFHLGNQNAFLIDIGGGSTELIVGDANNYHHLDSLKMGAIRLTSVFFMPDEDGPVPVPRYELIRQYVRNKAVRSIQRLKGQHFDIAIGSSGTIQNLADIAIQMEHGRPRERDDVMTYAQLSAAIENLCALSLKERQKVPGINPDRADIIIAGAAIIQTLMEELSIEELRITDRGLREGLLEDYLKRSGYAELVEESSVRMRSVMQLARKCGVDEEHARKAAQLALSLFDSTRELGLHDLRWRGRRLLEYSAVLHDIGVFLSYSNHQRHSYYLIRNADLLGFDQTEIGIMAATALFHRKKFPSRKYREIAELSARGRETVQVNAALLRIAESLDRSHQGNVTAARITRDEKGRLFLDIACEADCQLELWGVDKHKSTFKKIFGKPFKARLLDAAAVS